MLQSLQDRFYLNFIKDDRWMYIVDGLKVTLLVTFFAVLIGIVIGFWWQQSVLHMIRPENLKS